MGSLAIDRLKNQTPGKRGTGKESLYFEAGSDSGSGTYEVTLNYSSGHFCTCRGQIAKIRKFGAIPSLDPAQNLRLPQTSRHWCKHVHAMRSAPAEFRIEARKLRNEFFGIMETPVDPETGKIGSEVSPRRAAVQAQTVAQAAKGNAEAKVRLAKIEAQREALLAEIEAEQQLRSSIAQLIEAHGEGAVKAAMGGK